MSKRAIIPRRSKSFKKWYVHVPDDLRQFVGKARKKLPTKAEANAFAAELTQRRHFIQTVIQIEHLTKGFHAFKFEGDKLKTPSMSIPEAFEKVLESKKQSGNRANTMATLTCSLKSFAKACHKPAGDVTPSDVEAWLYAGDYATKTRKGRRTDLNTAFNWLVKHRMVAQNPVTATDAPTVPYKRPEILTVDEIEKILHACEQHDPALIGHVAMILFGGLRRGESARTRKDDAVGGKIQLDGDQTKLKKPRDVVVTETLSAWLAVPGAELGGTRLFERMKRIQELAGVKIPRNALRHSAASYARELMGAIESARLLGHSETVAAKSYVANVTHADAERFIALRPTPPTP